MLFKCLGIVFVATLVAAELPSYFKVCGRRNPQFEKCVLASVDSLRDKLREGIKELDTPPIEPLYLDGLTVANTDALQVYANHVKFTGFSNFEPTSFKFDFENKRFDFTVFFKELILDAEYDVKAKILVPIMGKGPIHIVAEDVTADIVMKYKLVKKNGAEYMFLPTMTTKLKITDYKTNFKPGQGVDTPLATAINTAIKGGRQEIIDSITPGIEKVVSTEVLKIANKIVSHFTFDELFPDRE